jgi:succinate-acetate transporter protein
MAIATDPNPRTTHTSVDRILEMEEKGAGIYFAGSSQGISLQLGCLAILLMLLGFFQSHLINPNGLPFMAPMALSFGAVGIFAGGMWNLRNGVTIAGVIGGVYGVFWLSFGLLLLLEAGPLSGATGIGPAGFAHALGAYLWVMAIVSATLAIGTLFVNKSVFAQQAVLVLVFVFLAIYYSGVPGGTGMQKLGGWVSIVDGVMALYVSMALVINETAGKTLIPLP